MATEIGSHLLCGGKAAADGEDDGDVSEVDVAEVETVSPATVWKPTVAVGCVASRSGTTTSSIETKHFLGIMLMCECVCAMGYFCVCTLFVLSRSHSFLSATAHHFSYIEPSHTKHSGIPRPRIVICVNVVETRKHAGFIPQAIPT